MRLIRTTLVFIAASSALAAADESYEVKGLEQPAEIIVDQWGIPHIYAGTHYDAFFVQGFNAARDRLWQIDTWRRRGLGRLAEVLGPEYIEQDKASRLFLYRGDMYREWLAYGSDAKKIAQAFTAGINAYIDLIGEQPDLKYLSSDVKAESWAVLVDEYGRTNVPDVFAGGDTATGDGIRAVVLDSKGFRELSKEDIIEHGGAL